MLFKTLRFDESRREISPMAEPWIAMTFRGQGDIKDQARETKRN